MYNLISMKFLCLLWVVLVLFFFFQVFSILGWSNDDDEYIDYPAFIQAERLLYIDPG